MAMNSENRASDTDGLNRYRLWKPKRTMRMGTWNVQGLASKKTEIQKLRFKNCEVMVLSETKTKSSGENEFMDYIHLWSGVQVHERAKRGVAILVHKKYRRKIIEWHPISERIITARVVILGVNFYIIGVYAPNEDAPEMEKDDFSKRYMNMHKDNEGMKNLLSWVILVVE